MTRRRVMPYHYFIMYPLARNKDGDCYNSVNYCLVEDICWCGEIGKHDRFRFYCRKACKFKSCHQHQTWGCGGKAYTPVSKTGTLRVRISPPPPDKYGEVPKWLRGQFAKLLGHRDMMRGFKPHLHRHCYMTIIVFYTLFVDWLSAEQH